MADVQRSEVVQKAIKELRLDPGLQSMPTKCSDQIILTYPLHSKVTNIVKDANSTSSGTSTVYTVPAGKQLYITSGTLSYEKDAASDCTAVVLQGEINGLMTELIDIRCLTLTASRQTIPFSFSTPLKIDELGTIRMSKTFTVGNGVFSAVIHGYEEEK